MSVVNKQEVIGATMTYGGAGTSIVSGVTITEIGAIVSIIGVCVGIVIGVLGYLLQLKYKRKQDKREEERHEILMRKLEKEDEARTTSVD